MENQWFSAILGKWYSYNIPEGYGNQNGLYRNMSSSHLEFFIECVDKIHPSHKKINFFELCLYVENQAIKQNRYDCGNLIRHLGSMRMKQGRTKTEKQLLKALRGENSIVDGYERSGNSSTWKEEYSRNAWLTPLYQCWYSLNKDNSKPEIGVENRLVINQEVIDEFEKNADKYVLVDIDLSKPRERKYWCVWWSDKEVDREKVNEWLKENANDGDWLLWGEGSGGSMRFQVIESVDDGINEFSLELKGIPGKLSSFWHYDRIPKGLKNAGRYNVEDYKWMDGIEGANGGKCYVGEVEQKNFFRTLKPIALDGVNFFLSSYSIDKGGNQWEKARSNNAVGFNTSKPTTKKIFDETDPEYDKNYTPKPKDVLLFRRSGAGKEGGLSDIFTIKDVSYDSTKIDKIKNKKPAWDAVDVVVYGEDKRIDLYEQGGCVYEGPYEKTMWSSTFHRWNGDELNKNDLNGEILKDGLVLSGVLVGYRTFYDYFEHIINGRWWKMIGKASSVGRDNQLNILRYIVTVYDRMEKIGLGCETGTIVNGEGSSVINDDLIKDIVNETNLEKELVESIVSELLDKKQIVLQGPPGTGKTFVAKKIAECMKRHGFGDERLIQFHASYSYEEFMEGYKPESGSGGELKFKIKNGIFKEFCLPPVMNTLELGDLYTRDELSNLFKLNDKANLHRYLGQGYEDRYKQFKKGGKHGSISFTGVFCYDERFDLNDNSIWLFVVEKKEQERQPSFEDFYDRKTGVLNWQTQEKQKNVSDDEFIHHEEKSRKIYVFYALENNKPQKYEFLGEFGYHNHTIINGKPTKFVFNKKQQFEKKGVFIIDEINRGRTSAIFGELMYLLEYRDDIITLPYSGRGFHIPDGVYIIGTMNTADRSIAMVDYALRRRFAFFGLEPNEELFNKPGTEFWIKDDDVREDVVMVMRELNDEIEKINGLGEGYRIGHSYFMRKGGIDREQFRRILEYRVGALVREYGQVIDDGAKESLNGVIEKFTQK